MAPKRSATIPVPTRPMMEVSPEIPSAPAAASAGTPWSMACETMWKIGPECAAQQAKCVRAIAQKVLDVQSAWDVRAGGGPCREGDAAAAGARLRRNAAGITMRKASSPRITKAVRQS